jgi:hypothetical protein
MEDIQERIYDLVEQYLPTYSLGLNILGVDVVFGNWTTSTGPLSAYAIVIVARPTEPGGAVLLGTQAPAEVNIHVICQAVAGANGQQTMAGDFWPSEENMKSHVQQACATMQAKFVQRNAPSNGGSVTPNPFTEALKRFQEREEGK